MLSPDQIDKLAGHILNRRDKRCITFAVLALYACAVVATYALPWFGLTAPQAALDSVEGMAMIVVVAHLTASVGTRAAAAWIAKDSAKGPQP